MSLIHSISVKQVSCHLASFCNTVMAIGDVISAQYKVDPLKKVQVCTLSQVISGQ